MTPPPHKHVLLKTVLLPWFYILMQSWYLPLNLQFNLSHLALTCKNKQSADLLCAPGKQKVMLIKAVRPRNVALFHKLEIILWVFSKERPFAAAEEAVASCWWVVAPVTSLRVHTSDKNCQSTTHLSVSFHASQCQACAYIFLRDPYLSCSTWI